MNNSPNDHSITFVCGNKKKIEEVIQILENFPISIKSQNIDLPEYQGDPEFVATEKCKFAANIVNRPVLIDDTSLCFNALYGLPGVYVKWFLEKIGHVGLNNMLLAYSNKSAIAQCIFAYSQGPNNNVILFKGQVNGTIV